MLLELLLFTVVLVLRHPEAPTEHPPPLSWSQQASSHLSKKKTPMYSKMVWQSWVQLSALEKQVVIEYINDIWVMGNPSTAWTRRGPLRVKTGLSLW